MYKLFSLCFLLIACEDNFFSKKKLGSFYTWSFDSVEEFKDLGYRMLDSSVINAMLSCGKQEDRYRCGLYSLYRSMQSINCDYKNQVDELKQGDLDGFYDMYCFVPYLVGCTPWNLMSFAKDRYNIECDYLSTSSLEDVRLRIKSDIKKNRSPILLVNFGLLKKHYLCAVGYSEEDLVCLDNDHICHVVPWKDLDAFMGIELAHLLGVHAYNLVTPLKNYF